jgi:predicted nucleic acid-binding protein
LELQELQETPKVALIDRNMWLYFFKSDTTELRKIFAEYEQNDGKHPINTEQ